MLASHWHQKQDLQTYSRTVAVQNTYFGETVWLFCVLLLLTMLGRAAFVFPFSFLHNWWARNEQLSIKEMIVIW